jgi:nitrogen fixation NifU-like protein
MDLSRSEQIEYLLEHYQHPHNYGEMEDASVSVEGGNPGCGDVIKMYLKMDGDRVESITFTGSGCTISQAAASILTDEVKGMQVEQVQELDFNTISELIGDEMVKMRPRCATLGLDTIKNALAEYRAQNILGDLGDSG